MKLFRTSHALTVKLVLNQGIFQKQRATTVADGQFLKNHRLRFSSNITVMAAKNLQSQSSPTNQLPKKSGLTSAILRYKAGEERFEFSFKYQDKIFNFNRPVSETVQSFAERAKANLAKKIKRFDESSQILCEFKNPNSLTPVTATEDLVFSNVFHPDMTDNAEIIFKIGNESIPVSVNPPEIFKIKFLKKSMIGFPILPISLEGSPNFVAEKSIYKWEFANSEDVILSHRKHLRKKSESEFPEEPEIWSPCEGAENSSTFTPDSSLLGKVVRLTVTPSNALGDRFGNPQSIESAEVTSPPVSKFLFQERLSRMEENSDLSLANSFRVVTYNILADKCATEEWFTGSPKDCLPMDYRLPLLNQEIKSYRGDIVCLQEVDRKFYDSYYQPFLSQACGMEGILCCKMGERTNNEGVAMFFNRKKFELLESSAVNLLEHMKNLPFFANIRNEKLLESLGDRATVLQVCVLTTLSSPNNLFLIANTHLYFHPTADHIRLLQTITCVNFVESKLEQLKNKFPGMEIHVLFCGDLNCTPPFGSVRYLTSGKVLPTDEDWTSNPSEIVEPGIATEHTLNLKNSHDGEELTNIVANFEGCIDYIMYQPESLQLLRTYPPPTKAKIAEFCGLKNEKEVSLPNLHTGSDHLPVIADFALRSH